jgi:hypothetical protein
MELEIIVVWFAVGIVTAIAAGARGRSPIGWFFIGLVSSLMGLIAVLVMRPIKKNVASNALASIENDDAYRDCPLCAEPIKKAAVKCKHCGSKVKCPIQDAGDDPTKPGWTIAFDSEDDASYVKMCTQLSDLDLPMVLDDDAILVGPYPSRSDALRVRQMLSDRHHLQGKLEAYVVRASA